MKKPALIIAVVAGYSLLEVMLLLIFLLPEESLSYQGSRHAFLALSQFLTIPGMAVLFSLILYGRNHWKRRMAIHFVTVPGFLMLILLMGLPAALIEWAYNERGMDLTGSSLFPIASLLYPVVILVMASVLIFYITRKAGKRVVVLESSRWLAERQAIRWSLWIPSLVVLTVFLFLPEVWGLLTPHATTGGGSVAWIRSHYPSHMDHILPVHEPTNRSLWGGWHRRTRHGLGRTTILAFW